MTTQPSLPVRPGDANPTGLNAPVPRPLGTFARMWQRRSAWIAGLALAGIGLHLLFRYQRHTAVELWQFPLLVTLVVGGVPQLFDLGRKLLRREFGSDLLGGISIVTSVLLGEYLAGAIIVLMLAGGEAWERYA